MQRHKNSSADYSQTLRPDSSLYLGLWKMTLLHLAVQQQGGHHLLLIFWLLLDTHHLLRLLLHLHYNKGCDEKSVRSDAKAPVVKLVPAALEGVFRVTFFSADFWWQIKGKKKQRLNEWAVKYYKSRWRHKCGGNSAATVCQLNPLGFRFQLTMTRQRKASYWSMI